MPADQTAVELDRFAKSGDPAALRGAADALGVYFPPGTPDAKARLTKLGLWLKILASLDRRLDWKFDPERLPPMTTEPPEGVNVPAGTDPMSVSDLAQRKRYMAAIEVDRLARGAYAVQYELHKLNTELTEQFKTFLGGAFEPLADAQDLEKAIRASDVSPIRKTQLREYLRDLNARPHQ